MSADFHMVRLDLEMSPLIRRARAAGIPVRDTDDGYLLHIGLTGLFGAEAPSPFAVERRMRGAWRILGYTSRSASDLRAIAQSGAGPELFNACRWQTLSAKPLPDRFPVDTPFAFRLRACPVVRVGKSSKLREGSEVDAFLSAVEHAPSRDTPVNRDEVYREWLEARLNGRGAELLDVRLDSMKLSRLVRRNHASTRKASVLTRPDVTFSGALSISDGVAFRELLRRGIGRHCSFGFGMLLLRPPVR